MQHLVKIAAGLGAVVTLAGCVENTGSSEGQPAVGSSSDLTSFEGARAGQSELGIQNLGYQSTRTEGLTTYWLNPSTGACAKIVTSNGRYSSVTMLPTSDC